LKFTLKFIAFILVLFNASLCFAQNKYRVYFKDKLGVEYNPYAFLHPKAIERRIIHKLNLCDSSDFPVQENYILKVAEIADSICGSSRWMNALFIYASENNLKHIMALPFVKSAEIIEPVVGSISSLIENDERYNEDFDSNLSKKEEALLWAQLMRMGGQTLQNNHLDGKGVRIAIFDIGFKSYLNNPAFEHIRKRNGIVDTYDFVKKRSESNEGMSHGTHVFSCIGGMSNNRKIGHATGADFLLARTENITEFINEEEKWLLAAEWADKNGADIINSSLGYTTNRYLPENMDGKTAFVSRAAQIAVSKGILVVSSAGNEGENTWKRIAAPGDAEGVLTVGGIDPSTGIHIGFSSYGPSWDRRLKPEVCAYGKAVVAGKNGLEISEGTSFSSPLVAGFAACIKQRYPLMTNTELKAFICSSGDLWPYYDYAHGYGVPQPYFLSKDTLLNQVTLRIVEDNFDITLYPAEWDTAYSNDSTMKDIKKNLIPLISTETDFKNERNKISTPPYLFYHIKNRKGYLDKYYVMNLKDEENGSISICKDISEKPFSIEFYYKGYYKEILITK